MTPDIENNVLCFRPLAICCQVSEIIEVTRASKIRKAYWIVKIFVIIKKITRKTSMFLPVDVSVAVMTLALSMELGASRR